MKARKLTTMALTGALALGGLGIGSMADLPIPGMSATQADAAVSADVAHFGTDQTNPSANVLNTSLEVWGWTANMLDFNTKHQARFTIKNSVGTVVKTGSLNMWQRFGPTAEYSYRWDSNTNISLVGLPKNGNHYRIDVSVTMDDGPFTFANGVPSSMSQAFTYNADGSLTNFR